MHTHYIQEGKGFRRGEIQPVEFLGSMLLSMGKVTESELDEIMAQFRNADSRNSFVLTKNNFDEKSNLSIG